jgi:hypothetical protein
MPATLKRPAKPLPQAEKDQQQQSAHEAHEMREHLTEKQIDKTLQDSFPASDPPAWY